jgi:hypothetical protein
VRLNRLLAQEQFARDLAVGLAVDDEPGDLEFARGERADPLLVGVSGAGSSMDALP